MIDPVANPFEWWIQPFVDNEFMQYALLAGLLTVVATSLVGTWIVLRGMTFLGDALAHGVLPGIAIAFVVGASTTLGAMVAAVAMVVGVNLLRRHSPLPDDTSIGVLFVGFLALAVVIMSSQSGAYAGELNRFLFGSITGVETADLWRQTAAALACAVFVVIGYRALLMGTFDAAQASLAGLRPGFTNAALMVLTAVAIVSSFEAVGNLLVFAFLVAPPATAALLVRRVPRIMACALLVGSVCVVVGLAISYHAGTAAGATMALCTVVAFGLAVVVAGWRGRVSTRPA